MPFVCASEVRVGNSGFLGTGIEYPVKLFFGIGENSDPLGITLMISSGLNHQVVVAYELVFLQVQDVIPSKFQALLLRTRSVIINIWQYQIFISNNDRLPKVFTLKNNTKNTDKS